MQGNNLEQIRFRPETSCFPAETLQNDSSKGASMADEPLMFSERLRQKMGRPSRIESVAIRFTEDELAVLERAAAVASDFVARPGNTVIVAPDRAERRELTQLIRADLRT